MVKNKILGKTDTVISRSKVDCQILRDASSLPSPFPIVFVYTLSTSRASTTLLLTAAGVRKVEEKSEFSSCSGGRR